MTGKRQTDQETAAAGGSGDAPPRAADKIRRTARELFYREGIRAVGVDEIVTKAGVTKPSLYRSFPSKDALAAAYLRDYEGEFWRRFNAAMDQPGALNPRQRLLSYLSQLAERTTRDGYRGCGLSNAAVEYPAHDHPARQVADEHKRTLRSRLAALAAQMGAAEPEVLGDGLMLLIEGAFVTGQLFGKGGPAQSVAIAADRLIEASVKR